MNWDALRLARLSLPAKLLITLLLLIIGPGLLFGTANIYFKHQNADGEPGLTIDDLRAAFHGMTKTFQPEDKVIVNSRMLNQVVRAARCASTWTRGANRPYAALITWLENDAKEDEFTKRGWPSRVTRRPQAVIKAQCIECHRSDGGDMEDIPYAATATSDPEYQLVMVTARPEITREASGVQTVVIKPPSNARLVHVAHAHIMTVPMFTFVVGVLFLMTGLPQSLKLFIGPLPMLGVLLDISGWWIAVRGTVHLRHRSCRRYPRGVLRPAGTLHPGIHVVREARQRALDQHLFVVEQERDAARGEVRHVSHRRLSFGRCQDGFQCRARFGIQAHNHVVGRPLAAFGRLAHPDRPTLRVLSSSWPAECAPRDNAAETRPDLSGCP